MPPRLAFALTIAWIVIMFWKDRWRTKNISAALFWPGLWFFVVSSRPLDSWLVTLGVPIPGMDSDNAADGSIIDRVFYGLLAMVGLFILSKRRLSWTQLARANPWLTALIIYLCLSCVWSSFMIVSAKRFIKLFGSIIMVLVVLTEADPVEAIATLIRRCAYINIPMSVLVIRYFRDIGIIWDYFGTSTSWQGMATSKNVLGQVAMVSGICFVWERARLGNPKRGRWIDFSYIAMSVYLLKGGDGAISLTSVSVFALALAVFVTLGLCKNNPAKARKFLMPYALAVFGLVAFIMAHSIWLFEEKSFLGELVTAFGRDITLTGRTEIWTDIYKVAAKNMFLGTGFGGFWIGRDANIPWNANMTWILGQAHNGYIDTYLQTGLLGFGLLVMVLFKTYGKIGRLFTENFEYARFCAVMFCVIVFVNITETTFLRGDHNLWMLFMLTVITVPSNAFYNPGRKVEPPKQEEEKDELEDEMDEESYRGPAVVP